jgi:DNA oxidative demethylase
MTTLFDSDSFARSYEPLEEGAVLLRGFAISEARLLIEEVARIAQTAAFRHLVTPGGYTMSVAMTNCGHVGWVSDRTGYRYDPVDPDTGAPWPAMPEAFLDIARRAAALAGFADYNPDACLINNYVAGAKLSLHQDRDEKDAWAPIVSVSLCLPYSCGACNECDRHVSCAKTQAARHAWWQRKETTAKGRKTAGNCL